MYIFLPLGFITERFGYSQTKIHEEQGSNSYLHMRGALARAGSKQEGLRTQAGEWGSTKPRQHRQVPFWPRAAAATVWRKKTHKQQRCHFDHVTLPRTSTWTALTSDCKTRDHRPCFGAHGLICSQPKWWKSRTKTGTVSEKCRSRWRVGKISWSCFSVPLCTRSYKIKQNKKVH